MGFGGDEPGLNAGRKAKMYDLAKEGKSNDFAMANEVQQLCASGLEPRSTPIRNSKIYGFALSNGFAMASEVRQFCASCTHACTHLHIGHSMAIKWPVNANNNIIVSPTIKYV